MKQERLNQAVIRVLNGYLQVIKVAMIGHAYVGLPRLFYFSWPKSNTRRSNVCIALIFSYVVNYVSHNLRSKVTTDGRGNVMVSLL